MFRKGEVHKTYWALVQPSPSITEATLTNWLTRNEQQNKSYAYNKEVPQSKKAVLSYRQIAQGDQFSLLEIKLMTGRHHQIRCQLAHMGCPIKGDLKYGAKRSNPDGSISLMARRIEFTHPVSQKTICVESPVPQNSLWNKILSTGNSRKETTL